MQERPPESDGDDWDDDDDRDEDEDDTDTDTDTTGEDVRIDPPDLQPAEPEPRPPSVREYMDDKDHRHVIS